MRRIDKKLNMMKVNLLAESRYLESKGLNETMIPVSFDSGEHTIAFAENEDELEEGFFNSVKNVAKKVVGIETEDELINKKKATEEINLFTFENLFTENPTRESYNKIIEYAKTKMPTVVEKYLQTPNGKFLDAKLNGKLGNIPEIFFIVLNRDGEIINDIAKGKLLGFLNFH